MYSDHAIPEDRSRKYAVLLLLLGAVALLAAAAYLVLTNRHAQTVTPGNFGAIAMSQSSLDFGSAWGYGNAASAEQRAISECNARTPHSDCVVRLNLTAGCGALAVSPAHNESVVAADTDKTLASAMALAQCDATGAEDCVVRQNFCGDGS